jgi:hypothetical protein
MQMIQETSTYQKRGIRKNIKKGEEVIYKEAQYTSFLDSGALVIKKGRITRRARYVDKY